jgi:hypothetical protein
MSASSIQAEASGRSGLATGLVVIAGVVLGVLAFAVHRTGWGPARLHRGSPPVARPASPDPVKILARYAHGLEIIDVASGGPACSLKVDSVQFEPGSLGFFRVGFLQTPILKDTRLRVDVPLGGTDTPPPEKALESALVSLLGRQELATLGLMAGVASIQAAPFHLQVNQGGREVLALEGERASVDLRRRQLDLEGRIRLSADGGARVLESERLHYSLETQQVWTDEGVRLRTPKGSSEAQGFRGDVFLRAVATGSKLPSEAKISQKQIADREGWEVFP